MAGVRGRPLVALGALVALASVPMPQHAAVAACVTGLQFDGEPDRRVVAPGETVTLSGAGYVEGCDDGGDPHMGCGAPLHERPRQDVELSLSQGSDEVVLAVADAEKVGDDFGHVSWIVTIPADVSLGRAVLSADGAELDIRIRSGQATSE